MITEPNQDQDRAGRITSLAMLQAVADVLRRLPEFQTRSEERIQKVSRELVKALTEDSSRKS